MIKADIIIQVKDGDKVYNAGDKVRALMKPIAIHRKDYEYVRKIVDIQKTFMTLDTGLELKVLHYGEILMIKSVSH
jgi:hypothetical protein